MDVVMVLSDLIVVNVVEVVFGIDLEIVVVGVDGKYVLL